METYNKSALEIDVRVSRIELTSLVLYCPETPMRAQFIIVGDPSAQAFQEMSLSVPDVQLTCPRWCLWPALKSLREEIVSLVQL